MISSYNEISQHSSTTLFPHFRVFSSTTKDKSDVETSLGLELQIALAEPDCEDFEADRGLMNVPISSALNVFSRC